MDDLMEDSKPASEHDVAASGCIAALGWENVLRIQSLIGKSEFIWDCSEKLFDVSEILSGLM